MVYRLPLLALLLGCAPATTPDTGTGTGSGTSSGTTTGTATGGPPVLALEVSPTDTDLGMIPSFSSLHFTIQVDANGGVDARFRVSALDWLVGGAVHPTTSDATVTVLAGDTLQYPANAEVWEAGVLLSEVRFEGVDSCQGSATVLVRALSIPPCMKLNRHAADFGEVPAGNQAIQVVDIQSCSDQDHDLDINFSDPTFGMVENNPVTLPANGSAQVTFTFDSWGPDAVAETASIGDTVVFDLKANDCANGDPALYDLDGDGLSSCGVAVGTSGPWDDGDGDGVSTLDGDCDDANAAIGPMADEAENGVDDDCDGQVDEDFVDLDLDAAPPDSGDCDDTNPWVGPAMPEIDDDGLDNDCNGFVDDDPLVMTHNDLRCTSL